MPARFPAEIEGQLVVGLAHLGFEHQLKAMGWPKWPTAPQEGQTFEKVVRLGGSVSIMTVRCVR